MKTGCAICGKLNHQTSKCFLNPLNPNKRLKLSKETKDSLKETDKKSTSGQRDDDEPSDGKKKRRKSKKTRAAMARIIDDNSTNEDADRMMLDS